ncbi:MAG: class I SAM-dependent methyltransferase [Flavobacteriaceae bacterium]
MSRPFFDRLYSENPDYYGRAVRPEFERFLGTFAPAERILDLGCGQGRHALAAAVRGIRVHAIDQSAVALEQLAREAAQARLPITTEVADLSSWPGPGAGFDGAVLVTSLDHLTPPRIDALESALRMGLNPGARIYVESFTDRDPGYRDATGASETRRPVRHYFAHGELARLFSRWQIVESREFTERDEGHGAAHMHGMAMLIARKPVMDR